MLDMQIFEGELLACLFKRHLFMQQFVQDSHDAGPVCARFAVHQRRIFDPGEQVAGAENGLLGRRIAGKDLEIDQFDACRLAGLFFQQVIAFGAGAAQIDDGADAAFLRVGNYLARRRLVRAPHAGGDLVQVAESGPQEAVVAPDKLAPRPFTTGRCGEIGRHMRASFGFGREFHHAANAITGVPRPLQAIAAGSLFPPSCIQTGNWRHLPIEAGQKDPVIL